ncbi:hypothetical protein D9758_016457 [Tetrapyrgos nigripes]|uniref:Uncharacterized protein n=1 Tax=Tetrapyrgos nigripes TaxID=182062 RepID=A0A8H5CC74_9AGAR|nr:hypothetical protein D9758_016457 [Tetrapyrgos nigripes]
MLYCYWISDELFQLLLLFYRCCDMPGRGSMQQRPWGSRKSFRRAAMIHITARPVHLVDCRRRAMIASSRWGLDWVWNKRGGYAGSLEHQNEGDRARLHFKGFSTLPNANIHFTQCLNPVLIPNQPLQTRRAFRASSTSTSSRPFLAFT